MIQKHTLMVLGNNMDNMDNKEIIIAIEDLKEMIMQLARGYITKDLVRIDNKLEALHKEIKELKGE